MGLTFHVGSVGSFVGSISGKAIQRETLAIRSGVYNMTESVDVSGGAAWWLLGFCSATQ